MGHDTHILEPIPRLINFARWDMTPIYPCTSPAVPYQNLLSIEDSIKCSKGTFKNYVTLTHIIFNLSLNLLIFTTLKSEIFTTFFFLKYYVIFEQPSEHAGTFSNIQEQSDQPRPPRHSICGGWEMDECHIV